MKGIMTTNSIRTFLRKATNNNLEVEIVIEEFGDWHVYHGTIGSINESECGEMPTFELFTMETEGPIELDNHIVCDIVSIEYV